MVPAARSILWVLALFWAGIVSAAASDAAESVADRRLLEIIEMEKGLRERAASGVGEQSLLVEAQDIAERYERYLKDNPENVYAWLLAGKFLRSIGADRRAFSAFARADELEADLPVVQQQLGQILAERGQYQTAQAYLLRAVDLAPNEARYHEDLGLFLVTYQDQLEADGVLEDGRAMELAHEAFRKAHELDPGNFERSWRWAESFADLAHPDWKRAAQAWREAHSLAATTAEKEASRLQLARAYLEAGDPKNASVWLGPVETEALRSAREELHRLVRLEESSGE